MTTSTIIETHKNQIDGVLTCLDRIVIDYRRKWKTGKLEQAKLIAVLL